MSRRAIGLAIALIALLAACGRQITPSTNSSGILAGMMKIRFDTAGVMNFNAYRYAIVFNTSGNGEEPYANAFTTSLLNYSFVWIVTAQNGGAPSTELEQVYQIPGGIQGYFPAVPTSQVQLIPNSNGLGTEFTLQFQRSLFNTIPPNASPTPTVTSSVIPSATPTIMGPSTSCNNAFTWCINVFTIDANNNIIDAGGIGNQDTSFMLAVDTRFPYDNAQPFGKSSLTTVSDPDAQIIAGEVINAP